MTVIRVQADLDPDHRQGVLDVLRTQPDVTAITSTAAGFDVELAGYALDAAEARTVELLRMAEPEAGVERGALRVVQDPEASPGGLG